MALILHPQATSERQRHEGPLRPWVHPLCSADRVPEAGSCSGLLARRRQGQDRDQTLTPGHKRHTSPQVGHPSGHAGPC